jgi:hypothetical protein
MNNYDEITEIIDEINLKIKEIDKQMILVEDIKPQFGNMDTFIPELESAYKEFDEALSNSILRTQELNKIVVFDAVNSYSDIYNELHNKCKDIMDELLESVNVVDKPIELVDTTPAFSNNDSIFIKELDLTTPIITDEFINRQVDIIKPIEIDRIDDDIIPVPTPIQPEIEILEM